MEPKKKRRFSMLYLEHVMEGRKIHDDYDDKLVVVVVTV